MTTPSNKALLRRVDRMSDELRRLRRALERDQEPRFVQVSYYTPQQVGRSRWDYIDGIGDLAVGDRVLAPSRFYNPSTAIVVGIGRGQDWDGPWSTITERVT